MSRSNLHSKGDISKRTGEDTVGVCKFLELKKVFDKVNREALWRALRMYDVDGNLLKDINSRYVNSRKKKNKSLILIFLVFFITFRAD